MVFASIDGMMTKTGKYKKFALLGIPVMIIGMLIMGFMDSIWLAVISMKLAAASGNGVDFTKLDPAAAEKLAATHNPQVLLDLSSCKSSTVFLQSCSRSFQT